MFIIKHKKIFIAISAVLVVLSIASLFVFGLKIGIDFKGGALTEVYYAEARPDQAMLTEKLDALGYGTLLVQPTGETGYIIKSRDLNDAEHATLLGALSDNGNLGMREESFNSIGPSVGATLARKAVVAIVLVSLAIILFIAYAFRKVSRPVASWKYGVVAIVSLLHDVIIPVGFFTYFSHYFGAEVDTLFVVAILTILGLSVSDTIVIFDRIRENLRNESNVDKADFGAIVGKSLSQSFTRSIATSLTVILVLLALVFFGPETTKFFALMLTVGMFFGTYSSIFLASPLLVLVSERQAASTNKA
ncbi:MAG: protein translocase subunit SecF [Candidatus Paceibacteria bacterium]